MSGATDLQLFEQLVTTANQLFLSDTDFVVINGITRPTLKKIYTDFLASMGTYGSIADGLAATSGTGTSNRFFTVPSTGDNVETRYRNDAGAAVEVGSLPSTAYMQSLATSVSEKLKVDVVPGLLVAIADLYGNPTWLQARDSDGGPPDWVITMLSSRLGLSGQNLPDTAHHHLTVLRNMRVRFAQMKAGDANAQLDIVVIGDSYAAGHLYFLNKLAYALALDWGFAGPGFIGLNHGAALGNTNFQYTKDDTANFGGSWVVSALGAPTPDNKSITAGAAGDYIQINAVETTGISTLVNSGKLLYLATATDYTIRYRWGDALAWETLTLPAGTGPAEVVFPVLPTGINWRFRLEIVTGLPTLYGVFLAKNTNGVRVSKLAASGSTSGNWYSSDSTWQAKWKASVALIPAHAYFIMLGANDQGTSVTPAQYLANMQGLVGMIRSINPAADIHLCMQAETPRSSTYPISAYGALLRKWAYEQSIPCSDLQYSFGKTVSEYASTGAFPLIGADNLHPNTPGGRLITEFFYRLMRAAQ